MGGRNQARPLGKAAFRFEMLLNLFADWGHRAKKFLLL